MLTHMDCIEALCDAWPPFYADNADWIALLINWWPVMVTGEA